MQKAELRKLRRLDATKEMMQKAKYKLTVNDKYERKTKDIFEYEAFIRIQNLGAYVKIAIYDPEWMRTNCTGARFEMFLNLEGQEFITRELDREGNEVKWLTSMIYNLLEKNNLKHYWWQYDSKQQIFINADAMKTLSRIPVKNERGYKGLERLRQWQQDIRDENIRKAEEREQKPWDEDMAKIPPMPKNIFTWARKNVLKEHYIVYDYSPKKKTTGWCTCCRHEVMVSEPRHNKEARCPHCKAKIIYKASGKAKTLYCDGYAANLIQKIDGGLVERTFTYSEGYRDLKNPQEHVYEYARRLIIGDEVKTYYYGSYKNKRTRWCLEKTLNLKEETPIPMYDYYGAVKVFTANLKRINHPLLSQSAYMLWDKLPTRLIPYVLMERKYPVIERLARVGMFSLAREMIQNRSKSELKEYSEQSALAEGLGIDKFRLKRLRTMNGNLTALDWLRYEKKQNEVLSDEMIKAFSEEHIGRNEISFALKKMSLAKTYNYLVKQAKMMDEDLTQTIRTWKDYLSMAEKAKMNLAAEQLFKPKDLKYAHDEMVLQSKKEGREKLVKELEKEWPKVDSQMPKLKKFEFAADGYQIVAPNGIRDIVTEGLCLQHCVHTSKYYYDRIQRDESYIFFLRKSSHPEFPWYTLEVEPSGNIRQKRTTGDKQNDDFKEAMKFLKKWQKYFRKQLTDEEIKLGVIADKLRQENYSQLRKDKKEVWHGKYAGQLLADILEADFMKAM